MIYKTGISKVYFRKDTLPEIPALGSDIVLVRKVKANSRTEAARLAWKDYYEKVVLSQLEPYIKRIGIYVNDPKAGASGLMGRLSTVIVWNKTI